MGGDETEEEQATEPQKQMVNKLHVNLGHPSTRECVRLLKCRHGRPAILRYAQKGLRCPDCEAHAAQNPRRKASMPRTYEFNKIVAMDLLYVKTKSDTIPFLNVVCHGTNYQQVVMLDAIDAETT